jgi:hypothetical protein
MSLGFIAEATANSVTWTAVTGVSWDGTAPTDLIGAEYNLTRVGKNVTVSLLLAYDTVGATNTSVVIPWQAEWPTPSKPSFIDAALEVFGGGFHIIAGSGDAAPTTYTAAPYVLRRNAANNGDEYRASFNSSARSNLIGSFTYQAI